MQYPLTFIVKSLPPNVGGCANGPFIRILEKYKDDVGIYKHELVHIQQWLQLVILGAIGSAIMAFYPGSVYPEFWWVPLWTSTWAHSALYYFFADYRLWAEVEAYQEQSKHYPNDRRVLFADFIAQNYRLTITPLRAYAELCKK